MMNTRVLRPDQNRRSEYLWQLFILFSVFCSILTSESAVGQANGEEVQSVETVIVKEQTIYIPYDNLRKTFEKNGRGVFLPYEEFQRLWEASRAKIEPPADDVAVPLPFLISETINDSTVHEDIIEVEATIRIELFASGWHEIPLRLNGVAITESTIDGDSAFILGDPEQGYRLLIQAEKIEKADGKVVPQSVELKLCYAGQISKSPGRNVVSFEVPQAPISRWIVKIPETGVKVDFFPLLAATQVKEEDSANNNHEISADDLPVPENSVATVGTTVMAFVGPSPTIRIGWTPKSEGATGLDALTTLNLQEWVNIDEGIIRTQAIMNYSMSRGEIESLAIEIPNDQKILNVFDPNVKSWGVTQGSDFQTIDIILFEKAGQEQRIVLNLEKLMSMESRETVDIPQIKGVAVARQQGVLGVTVSGTLTSEVEKLNALLQTDIAELSQINSGQPLTYAYRVSAGDYSMKLALEKVQPQITGDSQVTFTLETNSLHLILESLYKIEKAGVFQLSCDIPKDYDIHSVSGFSGDGITSAPVNTWHLQEISPESPLKRLNVVLSQKVIGAVGLRVALGRSLDEKDLRTPTGQSVKLVLPLPLVTEGFALRREGRAIFQSNDCFRILKVDTLSLQTIPIEQLRPNWRGEMGNAQLGFIFAQGDATLEVNVERRKPQIVIRQLESVRIEDGVARFRDTINYEILYSGVKSLRIDIPAFVSSKIHNQTPGVRDSIISPQPEDVATDYVAWEFFGGSELIGNGQFSLYWEEELGQLEVGKSVEIAIPSLVPKNVNRSYGHVVISKAATIDIGDSPDNKGIRSIDPREDIPVEQRVEDAACAFEFFDDWNLLVNATRYELEEVKRTAVLRGLVQMVRVNNAKTFSVQALYQMKSVEQRLILQMPEGTTFDLDPRINGVAVTLERDSLEGSTYHIPLSQTSPDTPFLLELRYSQPGSNGMEAIHLPIMPGSAAVQEMFVGLYIPADTILTGFLGRWTPLFYTNVDFRSRLFKNKVIINNVPTITELEKEFRFPGGVPERFPAQGKLYLFSALQPGASGNAILRYYSWTESHFFIVAFLFFTLFCAALTPLKWVTRGKMLLLLLVVILLLNLAFPTLFALLGSFGGGFPPELFLVFGGFIALWIFLPLVRCFRKRQQRAGSVSSPMSD